MSVVQAGKIYPKNISAHSVNGSRLLFESPEAKLEISVLAGSIIRFRFAPAEFEKDFSYAINPEFRISPVETSFSENENQFTISTPEINVRISRKTFEISVTNAAGAIINEDLGGFHYEPHPEEGGYFVYCSKKIQPHEYFTGLGDKPTGLNLRGKRFQNWGTDTYGFSKDQDPLYRSIPFYFGLHADIGYGIFFDNSCKSFFDFGQEDSSLCSFWAEGGEMNYYFIYGPGLLSVAEKYAGLTGTPGLPPLWSLGYHQSKWSYFPESKVAEVAQTFRRKKIPCDAIHLDIDYMDGFRCFTWDKERFPDPVKMISELNSNGFKTICILDPGIKIDPEYFIYSQALENNFFCTRKDGSLMAGKVWPGDCNFPDFTNPAVREWWSSQFGKLIKEQQVNGIWNDMNEPAVFDTGTFPDDVQHNYDGMQTSHRVAHNVYGMQMARATLEGMKRFAPECRPFVLTRSGFAGVQRYAAVWTGDNVASWEHLWIANMQCQRLSISGISFCGSDIGGFTGKPDGELFVRFIQMAVFHPFFRSHSSSDQGEKEPWSFGTEFELCIRQTIELRYRLLPYIYTAFYQYSVFGTPMIRPLSFIFSEDKETLNRHEEFIFGDHLLVCPVGEPGVSRRKIYLPEGRWVNYRNDKIFDGKQETVIEFSLNTFPFFVRSGAVIQHFPLKKENSLLRHLQDLKELKYSDPAFDFTFQVFQF